MPLPDGMTMPGLLPLDTLDHRSNFDADTFAGYDRVTSCMRLTCRC